MMFRSLVVTLAVGLAASGLGTASARATEAAASTPWVGAYTGCHNQCSADPATLWDQKNSLIGDGKLSYSRDFDRGFPAAGLEAWRKVPSPRHFYSVRPPKEDIDGFLAGRYDDALKAVVRELPAGTKVTIYHEPEDDMSGQTFAAVLRHFKTVVKSVNPEIPVWYVAMAYQWRTNSKHHVPDNRGWIDAAKIADAVGVDVYATSDNFKSIAEDRGFTRWWNQIKVPSGKANWGIVERGITNANKEAARVKMLKEDWSFVQSRNAEIFMYWDFDEEQRYELRGANETRTYRDDIARHGRTR